jgi:hypothetical protein
VLLSRALGVLGVAFALLALAGCFEGGAEPARDRGAGVRSPAAVQARPVRQGGAAGVDAVLYSIGVSSDPYGRSSPRGFGVVSALGTERQRKQEMRDRRFGAFGGVSWIDGERILVPQKAPPFRRPLLVRFTGWRLERAGVSPLPALEAGQAWSPDGRWIASKRIEPCEPGQRTIWECYRNTEPIYLYRADGSQRRELGRGSFNGWTPDSRLLVTDQAGRFYEALDVATGARTVPIAPERVAAFAGRRTVSVGPPRWSADGLYLAARVGAAWPKRGKTVAALVIASADGRPLRIIKSRLIISMFAWSPVGHRLAYTTSGFPDPHELFLVEQPAAKPRRLFATRARHFDWVSWSPDARRLLLDDEHQDRWLLLRATEPGKPRSLPRLGGRPLWCCPVNAYATLNG